MIVKQMLQFDAGGLPGGRELDIDRANATREARHARRRVAPPRRRSPTAPCSSTRRRSRVGRTARSRSAARSRCKRGNARDETFGTLEATATAHVDKVVALGRVDEREGHEGRRSHRCRTVAHSLAAPLSAALPNAFATVSLDRLQASLAASDMAPATVAVSTAPPRVIVSNSPAILVPIDGAPVWKPVAGSAGFTRVINTRALIMKSPAAPQIFMRVYDGWLMANYARRAVDAAVPAAERDGRRRRQKIAATRVVDLLDGGKKANPKPTLAQGIPAIYTSETPAELIVFKGNPEFAPIVGTSLSWASNTTSDVLRDAIDTYYVLLAGRWFRAPSLVGPVDVRRRRCAAARLRAHSADVARRRGARRGARHAAGARSRSSRAQIPQTATVPRKNGPAFTAKFDGPPQFVDEPGTSLSRARERVGADRPRRRCVLRGEGGHLVHRDAADGTVVGGDVGAARDLRDSADVADLLRHVRAHLRRRRPTPCSRATRRVISARMVGPGGTVVYGTGYALQPWIGNAWYPAPATYGVAAAPVFNPRVGYTYGFATGLATPSWSGSAARSSTRGTGATIRAARSTSANVYRAWFKPAKAKTAKPAPARRRAGGDRGAVAQRAAACVQRSRRDARYANSGPQVPIRHMGPERGYDMSMVTNADGANAGPVPATAPSPPTYISANEYYASLAKNGGWDPNSASNNTYAGADGKVYRAASATAGSSTRPAAGRPRRRRRPTVVAEAQSRANVDPGMQAGSYGMSNATRFTGQPGDGWSRRDSGDGGYSRTLGGDGGISAEYNNYRDAVLNNEFDIAANGGWWSDSVYLGGVGWGGRLGGD